MKLVCMRGREPAKRSAQAPVKPSACALAGIRDAMAAGLHPY